MGRVPEKSNQQGERSKPRLTILLSSVQSLGFGLCIFGVSDFSLIFVSVISEVSVILGKCFFWDNIVHG